MKKLITIISFFLLLTVVFAGISKADIPTDIPTDVPDKTFTKKEIKNLSGAYLEGKLEFENPLIVDVDKDGDFDALKFDNGNVEYYKNVGSLESPSFILENKNYEQYDPAFFVNAKIPYPIFFADRDGDADMDLFVVKDKEYNKPFNKYDYEISYSENALDLDTGTLITIILILVIVILVLAILGR
jgi:hypothetical protein